MNRLMAFFSLLYRSIDRVLAVFPEWFGIDKVQASVIVFGTVLIAFGIVCEMGPSSPDQLDSGMVNQFYFNFTTNQPIPASGPSKVETAVGSENAGKKSPKYRWRKIAALVLISVGTSVVAAGIILRITRRRDALQESLEKAGVLFVGDRNAFDEVIGWDEWINETHRCSDLIIIGKDQIKWAELSAEAISRVLSRDIHVSFIFQGKMCDQSLQDFWNELKQKDPGGRFVEWRKAGKLKLFTNKAQDGNYGYYWNGEKLVVKLYFEVESKIQAPLIVFDVRFASGRFNHTDFSAGTREHVPFWEKKRMLFQAGLNIWKIHKDSKLENGSDQATAKPA